MGIPSLFGFLSRKYKNENLIENFNPASETCDNFFIDYNGLIHKVINDLKEQKSDADIFEEILSYTVYITNLVNPRKRVMIAVDGVAPRAKMNQQRMRRFKSAMNSTEAFFDRNRITPGTDFMNDLDVFLEKNIFKSFPGLEVIYSGVNERGEGEHKIMEYLRPVEKELRDDFNTLAGLDADLIMLTASLNLNFKLLREEQARNSKKTKYITLDVNLLKNLLIRDMKSRTGITLDTQRFIRDFIIISFFIGNDFLTNLPLVKIRQNGLNILLNNYARLFKTKILNKDKYIVGENKKIDEYSFNKFIKVMGDGELYELGKLGVDAEKFKKEYYSKNFQENSMEFTNEISTEYTKGVNWVADYYLIGAVDWQWYYPFYYSMFASDILKYSSHTFEEKQSVTPEQQLVCVLPVKSLPEKFKDKTNHPRIRYMFPTSFKIDNSDPNVPEHARAAIIPFVNTDILFDILGV